MLVATNRSSLAALQEPSSSSAENFPTFVATSFKQRDQWSKKLLRDRRLREKHRLVLGELALCARLVGGRLVIDPTYAELAEAAGCGKRTAIRVIEIAEANGIVRKKRHSDGRVANSYELVLSNGAKNDVPTVPNFEAANCGNGAKYGGTVLRVEEEVLEGIPNTTISECAAPAARTTRVDRIPPATETGVSFLTIDSARLMARCSLETKDQNQPTQSPCKAASFSRDGSNNGGARRAGLDDSAAEAHVSPANEDDTMPIATTDWRTKKNFWEMRGVYMQSRHGDPDADFEAYAVAIADGHRPEEILDAACAMTFSAIGKGGHYPHVPPLAKFLTCLPAPPQSNVIALHRAA